jgi:hypothetical protein
MRDKRLREAKLAGKSIAEQMADEETDESAVSWISRVRTMCVPSQWRALYTDRHADVAHRPKTAPPPKPAATAAAASKYTEQDLSGLRVRHELTRFDLGEERILTLKDKTIAEDGSSTHRHTHTHTHTHTHIHTHRSL